MCVFVCAYIHKFYVNVCICTYMYACLCQCVSSVCLCILCVCARAWVRVCVCVCVRVCVCVCVYGIKTIAQASNEVNDLSYEMWRLHQNNACTLYCGTCTVIAVCVCL